MNYYSDSEPYVVAWLNNLIAAGLIPLGEVDGRSIKDVRPSDLRGFTQVHMFAGLGGWPLALQLAGWPADRPVWTGSCPCQPFSAAGKRRGFADDRHLWPVWSGLIRECKPAVVFGEQVASASQWLGLVRSDLEEMGYAVGCMPIEAASVGAPHKRDRFWFTAVANEQGQHAGAVDAEVARASEFVADATSDGWQQRGSEPILAREAGRSFERNPVADSGGAGWEGRSAPVGISEEVACACSAGWWELEPHVGLWPNGISEGVDALRSRQDAQERGMNAAPSQAIAEEGLSDLRSGVDSTALRDRPFRGFDVLQQKKVLLSDLRQYLRQADEARLLVSGTQASKDGVRGMRQYEASSGAPCRPEHQEQCGDKHPNSMRVVPPVLAQNFRTAWADGSWENATPRVARDVPARVAKLRALGNAIVPQCGAEFIKAVMECMP